MLWSMFPNHPNLLPAYFDDPTNEFPNFGRVIQENKWISKPLFGREGKGILHSKDFSDYDAFVYKSETNYGLPKKDV